MKTAAENADAGGFTLRLKILWYLLGMLALLAVALVSLMPAPPQVGVNDKLSHLLTYFVLGAWFAVIAEHRRALAIGALGLVGYGALLELLQGLGGHRYAEMADLLANAAGIALGLVGYATPLRRLLRWVDRRLAGLILR